MCGLVDYQALQTSITRVALLTTLGAAACALHKLVSLFRARKQKPGNRSEAREAICPAGSLVESPR